MTTIINQRVAPLYVLPLVRCEHRPNGVADPAAALKLLRHKSYKLRSEEPIGLHELPASLPMSSSLEMQLFWWYGSSAVCILAALLFRRIQHKIYRVLGRWSRYLAYIILIRRGFWSAISITVLDAIVLLVFIGVNTALAVFSLRSSLIQIAVTNLIPLFLGGRTNFVADFLNIPLHTYHLGHRWLGRVVIAQALTHSIINFDSRTGSPPALSGLAGAILLSVNLITSSLPVRRCSPLLFLWTHRILALSSLGVITLHVYLCKNNLTSFAFAVCLIATGLFVASFVLRWGRVWYQRRAEVTHYEIVGGAIRLWVRTRHSVESRPGAYFYISFPGAPWRYRLQSYFIPVAFWSSEMRDTTRELSFLLHPELPKALRLHLERDLERNHKTRVKLDGAYGERIGIEQFDLVILTADGQGIAGVVSFALSALSRWKFDRKDKAEEHNSSLYGDKTRKIDLIWLLEDNSQVEWASPYFRALADMDQASKKLLMVWILYPQPFEEGKHVPHKRGWIERHRAEPYTTTLSRLISRESNWTPGSAIVLTCGSGAFTQQTRDVVRASRADSIICKEIEYRPPGTEALNYEHEKYEGASSRNSVFHTLQKRKQRLIKRQPEP